MHLRADIAPGRDAHKRHLKLLSCPERRAEIPVLPRFLHDIRDKWLWPVIGLTYAAAAVD